MRTFCTSCIGVLLLLACGTTWAQGDRLVKPFLSPLFTDNMVLQRDAKAAIWGWAKPGMPVSVQVQGKKRFTVTTDAAGKWLAKIGPYKAGGPFTITLTSGSQTVTLQNVLFGDVWICSGQSNMDIGIKSAANANEEIAAATYPEIRLFVVNKVAAIAPQELLGGSWKVCTPETVASDGWEGFSATAYFFARQLHRDLHVPIGLVLNAWSGMPAEPFITSGSLKRLPEFRALARQLELTYQDPAGAKLNYAKEMDAWWAVNDLGTKNGAAWQDPALDSPAWAPVELPRRQKGGEQPGFAGIVWFRLELTLAKDWAAQPAILHLGTINHRDTTFVNGVSVGDEARYDAPRNYYIPARVLKEGRNVIAVRVFTSDENGGFSGTAAQMSLEAAWPQAGVLPIPLAGSWKYQVAARSTALTTPPELITGTNPYCPTMINNGMVHPLLPMAIKGVIWYQGETNTERSTQYYRTLPVLINDWRQQFGQGDFPFLVAQLANFGGRTGQPQPSDWAIVRDAQLSAAKTLPHVGLAVTIDIGEGENIHPKDKQDVGLRLALLAEAMAYHRKQVAASGPLYQGYALEGSTIRISFRQINGGLVAKGKDKLVGFAIAGNDRQFVWANATIDGDTVVVSSPKVARPVAVRYAWADNPECNLYNNAGLPASPFRTDAFAR